MTLLQLFFNGLRKKTTLNIEIIPHRTSLQRDGFITTKGRNMKDGKLLNTRRRPNS